MAVDHGDPLLDLLDEVWNAAPASPRSSAIQDTLSNIQMARSRSRTPPAPQTPPAPSEALDLDAVTDACVLELSKICRLSHVTTTHYFDIPRAIDPRIPENFDLLLQHCNQQIQMITQCSGDVFYIGICCSPYTR
jgi:hypothetical protein